MTTRPPYWPGSTDCTATCCRSSPRRASWSRGSGVYAERLDAALRRARDGDMSWLTRPMVDSYHTVWFELHEELIGLAGSDARHRGRIRQRGLSFERALDVMCEAGGVTA